jgi:hypothetical protein
VGGISDSTVMVYPGLPFGRRSTVAQKPHTTWQFQCPDCGFGHFEVGHLVSEDEIYCVVCREAGRLVRVRVWETIEVEQEQARLPQRRSAA